MRVIMENEEAVMKELEVTIYSKNLQGKMHELMAEICSNKSMGELVKAVLTYKIKE